MNRYLYVFLQRLVTGSPRGAPAIIPCVILEAMKNGRKILGGEAFFSDTSSGEFV